MNDLREKKNQMRKLETYNKELILKIKEHKSRSENIEIS